MKRSVLTFISVVTFLILAQDTFAIVFTHFESTNIGGGIYGSAQAQITSGSGWLEIKLTNTSPLGPVLSGEYANPFITEIEFKYLPSFTVNESTSYVSSLADTLFAKGKDNAAVNYSERHLYYGFVAPDTPNMHRCYMTADADNIRNDNTIGSINILDVMNIPQEGHAVGFLNPSPYEDSGAVFDTAIFHFAFYESGVPDESFYTQPGTWVVKYVGGGNYSTHVANVPEPATVLLLGLGGLALLIRRKR